MNEEEALILRDSIVNDAETLIESGHYTLEEVVAEIEDTLVHLQE